MKKFFTLALFAIAGFATLTLSSCATMYTPAGTGLFYTDVTSGEAIVEKHGNLGTKVGRASATGVLGLVSIGDAGINKAARSGGISKITHVDKNQKSILGLFGTYEVIVYGE